MSFPETNEIYALCHRRSALGASGRLNFGHNLWGLNIKWTRTKDVTYLFNGLHKVMLIYIVQNLYLFDDMLVVIALDSNRNRKPAHDQRVFHAVVFRHGLQVWNFERGGVLVEDIGEVLDQQPVKPFESVEA